MLRKQVGSGGRIVLGKLVVVMQMCACGGGVMIDKSDMTVCR